MNQPPRNPRRRPARQDPGPAEERPKDLPQEPDHVPEPGIVDHGLEEEGILIDIMCKG